MSLRLLPRFLLPRGYPPLRLSGRGPLVSSIPRSREPPAACSRQRIRNYSSPPSHSLQASYYRGGTSRAVMFNRDHLPTNRPDWDPIFCGVIGSPDRYGRQLDGFGAGISSLSKICVVGRPTPTNSSICDVEFTFAHVNTKTDYVDYTGNCGNMLSAVGPFAWDTGIVDKESVERYDEEKNEVALRILNTNTGKVIRSTFPLADGGKEAASAGNFSIDGVEGTAAKIKLDFLSPGGSKTGKMLPAGVAFEMDIGQERVQVSMVDIANPCVFVQASDIDTRFVTARPDDPVWDDKDRTTQLESIRCRAAVKMGLSKDEKDAAANMQAVPKIILVTQPKEHKILSGEAVRAEDVDVIVRAVSMGLPHRAIPITAAICTAAAAKIEGTVVNRCYAESDRQDGKGRGIRIGHTSGVIEVDAAFDESGNIVEGTVYRTARRLMEGTVFWK